MEILTIQEDMELKLIFFQWMGHLMMKVNENDFALLTIY